MPPKYLTYLSDSVRNGFTAERKFTKAYIREARGMAKYHIPDAYVLMTEKQTYQLLEGQQILTLLKLNENQ